MKAAESPAVRAAITAEILIDDGYQVDVTEDGAAAWSALQFFKYDLLITNQFTAKVSGVELLKKIHFARMTLTVIMATGIMPTWEFALHTRLQPIKMLLKPYFFEKSLGMVKIVLHASGGARSEISPPLIIRGQPAVNTISP